MAENPTAEQAQNEPERRWVGVGKEGDEEGEKNGEREGKGGEKEGERERQAGRETDRKKENRKRERGAVVREKESGEKELCRQNGKKIFYCIC